MSTSDRTKPVNTCENIDGQCGASWCDCDYQKKKQHTLSTITAWPIQPSGNRFEYRELNGEWQVYGYGLIHVCMCGDEEKAAIVCQALNKALPNS